jgi:hypothetical protein
MNQKTYWNHQGKYPKTHLDLAALVPSEGSVPNPYKNKALERFRKACNKYYRLYNDGDFNVGAARMFGIDRPSRYRRFDYPKWNELLYAKVEEAINVIIEEAAREQNIELG